MIGVEKTPTRGFNRPVVAGTGVHTRVLLQRFLGGDSVAHLAVDYRLTTKQIETALRFEFKNVSS